MGNFAKGSVEFLTVAIEVCKYLESDSLEQSDFIDKMRKLIPLVYLKVSTVEPLSQVYDEEPEKFVDENDYEVMRNRLVELLGKNDQYLTAIHPDIRYSDTTISATISEDLSDVYQSLKDFVCTAKTGNEDLMNDALIVIVNDFKEYWGAKLLNAQMALHLLWANAENENEE